MKKRRISPRASAALRDLGRGIQLARRRRRVRQRDLAARMGVSVSTLRALEAGEPGVSMGSFAMALLTLGILSRLDDLGDVGQDDIGLLMDIDALPQRVRLQTRRAPAGGGSASTVSSAPKGALL